MNKKSEYIIMDLFTILFIISLIKSQILLIAIGAMVIFYGFISNKNLKFLKTIKLVAPFLVLMTIPYMIEFILGNGFSIPNYMRLIMAKILISAFVLGIVTEKYSQLALVDGIVNMGLNPILSRIIALTFRYFYMINQDVTIGRKALEARGIMNNRGLSKISIWGEWIGGFFLKSNQHAEQVYNAMLARGFSGEGSNSFIKRKDLVIRLSLSLIVLILILVVERGFLIGN